MPDDESIRQEASLRPKTPIRKVRSFWDEPPDLDELAQLQGVEAVESIESLVGDFWPEDESVDEFNATIRAWRHGEPPPRSPSGSGESGSSPVER